MDDVAGNSRKAGKYERVQNYYRKKPVASSKKSYDKETSKKLWDLSEKLTGLKKED